MNAATDQHAANEKITPTAGRDTNGRFAPGNPGGPGNPYARKVAQLRKALVNFITEEDMKEIALVLKEKAKMGNTAAIKLLYQYVLGRPLPPTDPDRLNVDEWQKLQESARPPAEMDQVMSGLPAEIACNVTKIAWPCAVEQNFTGPFLANLQAMDERDAQREAEKKEQAQAVPTTNDDNGGSSVAGSAPKTNGDNGGGSDPAPKTNGPNGAAPGWWDQLVEEMLAETREAAPEQGPSLAKKR